MKTEKKNLNHRGPLGAHLFGISFDVWREEFARYGVELPGVDDRRRRRSVCVVWLRAGRCRRGDEKRRGGLWIIWREKPLAYAANE